LRQKAEASGASGMIAATPTMATGSGVWSIMVKPFGAYPVGQWESRW
jgi:hypothetical protein